MIFLLLAVGVSSYLIIESMREGGDTVLVTVNGKTVAEYSLEKNGEYEINGGTNILVIEDGYAYMKSANCPDHLCVHQGKISLSGERIVCLPNKVMIEVLANSFAN